MTEISRLSAWCRDFARLYQDSIDSRRVDPQLWRQEMNRLADLIIATIPVLPEGGELILIPSTAGETWAIAIDPSWPEMVYRADAIMVYPVVSLESCCIAQACEVAA